MALTKITSNGIAPGAVQGVNTGIVVPWGSASIPSGFLLCDGTSYSTTTYADLFAVIGYTYGGSGANFNVPDLRDRTTIGASAANSKTLAQTYGANTVTPTGNICGSVAATTLTTQQIPSHLHTGAGGSVAVCGRQLCAATASMSGSTANTGGGQSHSHNLSANFVGSANSVLQPSLVLNYIIKT